MKTSSKKRNSFESVLKFFGLICSFMAVCLFLLPKADAQVATGIQIPVIVNIYANSGTTTEKAKEAITEANKILKQAGMTFRVVQVNNPPGAGNGDNGDGKFSPAERGNIRTFGGKELDSLKNKKGIKISFGDQPTSEHPTNPGVAVHKNPTILVKDRGDKTKTAQTIAHEFGHVMTLSSGHKIDATTTANNGGHAPNVAGNSGKKNLMAPSNYREGSHLTPDQIKEMKTRKYYHGKCATQWEETYPAKKDKQHFGAGTDDRNDQVELEPIHDLNQVYIISWDDSNYVDFQITLAGAFPSDYTNYAEYSLGFDVDNDVSTGKGHGGLYGIDRIVYISLYGDNGNLMTEGFVENTINSDITDLPEFPVIANTLALYELDMDGTPEESTVEGTIPTDLLGFTAVHVPVVLTAGLPDFVADVYDIMFNRSRWLEDASLETFGNGVPTPGEDYPVMAYGLEPGSAFDLYLDDMVVLSSTLDMEGFYDGSFIFPSELPNTEMYFLCFQDETGEFAYNITCPEAMGIYENGSQASLYLSQNFPNPFSEATTIKYQLLERGTTQLVIYNIIGQELVSLVSEEQKKGYYSYRWNGNDASGNAVPEGIYICRLTSGSWSASVQMVKMK